ncbi:MULTISPECIES: hypothetical protein [unclassified Peribacillus]|uniref:hypothetical protein n=1 Tax=unclassified Peribacillus TaxID=2675266 RepID=UPI00366DCD53
MNNELDNYANIKLKLGGDNVDDKLMEIPFPELISKLAVAPLYIFMVIMAILNVILNRKNKGCFNFFLIMASWVYICIYLLALYFFFFGK